jgi:hypothetical protein
MIDEEWASSLVGLQVKVPEYWWPGYSGKKLCSGRISSIDMNNSAGTYFMFRTDEGPFYPMRYDAVLKYADKEQPNFSKFNLPAKPLKAKKRKAASASRSGPSKVCKKEASKLKKLISGDGVDVIGDLKKRLTEGDPETVNFLKSMYSVDKVKKCLLCGEEAVPGGRSKCNLIHDVEWGDYERDLGAHCRGEERGYHSGSCNLCGESVGFTGDDEGFTGDGQFGPSDRQFGSCYKGKHVFTQEEKEKIVEALREEADC